MQPQSHTMKLGKTSKARLIVNYPTLNFLKGSNVEWDLSECSEEHQAKVLTHFGDILKKKIEKRHLEIPIKLSICICLTSK